MPDGVFAAKVITPLASTLKGPVVIGVTLLLAAVTGTPFKVSFPVTLPGTVVTTVPDGMVTGNPFTASITLDTTIVEVTVEQFVGTAPFSQMV